MTAWLLAACAVAQLPTLADPAWNARLHGGRQYEQSRVYWHDGRFKDCRWEIGPDGVQFTNAGMEFPWARPAGRMHDHTIKLMHPAGVRPRIITLKQRHPTGVTHYPGRDVLSGWVTAERPAWQWPKGTTVFELHMHPGGWPFELRALTKLDDGYGIDNWDGEVFSPFASHADLPPAAQVTPSASMRSMTSRHPMNTFHAEALVWEYPDVDVDWAREVMSRKWTAVTGGSWHHTGRGDRWLSPKGYFGWVHGLSMDGCVKCHGNAGQPVELFQLMRDWYGCVPGSDGLLTGGDDPVDRRLVTRYNQVRGYAWTD